MAEHTFEWKVDKEATETATGLKHEECSVCGYKRNENTVIEKIEKIPAIQKHIPIASSFRIFHPSTILLSSFLEYVLAFYFITVCHNRCNSF